MRTRIAVLCVLASIACRKPAESSDSGAPSPVLADAKPAGERDASADATIDAAATQGPGTPPEPDAELYAAIDGPCQRADPFAVADATVVALSGNRLLRITSDGFDTEVGRGLRDVAKPNIWDSEDISDAGGRADDLWVQTETPGSVFREARIYRRREGHWSSIGPLGTDHKHYLAPEAWRGGAIGVVIPYKDSDTFEPMRLIWFDLPKEVIPGRMFPGDVEIREVHGLSTGELLARGARKKRDGAEAEIVFFVLGPEDKVAKALKWKGPGHAPAYGRTITGRTRATLRVIDEGKRYRLDGETLVPEEIENAPEWRRNGAAVQHLVGAGYHDVVLPRLPISGGTPKATDLVIGHDGEAFVAVKSGTGQRGLLRSHRPAEIFRCPEPGK